MTKIIAKKIKKEINLNADILSREGKKVDSIELPENAFGLSWNGDLVHQVITSLQTSARNPYAHAKTRGEVRGGGKKPWRQKGTGRARHGSNRSPIWVGGGVAHGPRNDKNFDRKVNKKAKDKTIAILLSKKYSENEIIFIKDFNLENPKTTEIKTFISDISKANSAYENMANKKHNTLLIVTPKQDKNIILSARNFGNIDVQTVSNINPILISTYKYIAFISPKESIEGLTQRFNK